VPESRGTTTVVFSGGGGGLLLLMQPDTRQTARETLATTFMLQLQFLFMCGNY